MDVKRERGETVVAELNALPQPSYQSPLLALLQGKPTGPPPLIEIPEPTPELAARMRALDERRDREAASARGRAYAHRPDLAPLGPADPELVAEWVAWHEQHADAWRPDEGELDVGQLLCIGPADLLPYEPVDRYADTWEVT